MSNAQTALEVFGLVRTMLPAVRELVGLAERLLPDDGSGNQKKGFVIEAVDGIIQGMDVTAEVASQAAPAVSAVIDSAVKINNSLSLWR